jgi:hypothetical protein
LAIWNILISVDIRVVVTTEHSAVISNTQQCIANVCRVFTATTPRSLRANAAPPGDMLLIINASVQLQLLSSMYSVRLSHCSHKLFFILNSISLTLNFRQSLFVQISTPRSALEMWGCAAPHFTDSTKADSMCLH